MGCLCQCGGIESGHRATYPLPVNGCRETLNSVLVSPKDKNLLLIYKMSMNRRILLKSALFSLAIAIGIIFWQWLTRLLLLGD